MVSEGGWVLLSSILWRSSRFESDCKLVATVELVGSWEYEPSWCDSSFPEDFHRVWIVEWYGTGDNVGKEVVV